MFTVNDTFMSETRPRHLTISETTKFTRRVQDISKAGLETSSINFSDIDPILLSHPKQDMSAIYALSEPA